MHRDVDFELERELPAEEAELTKDLELSTLWEAMEGGDQFLFEVARRAMLQPLNEPEAIRYRQAVLADAIARPEVVRELYELAGEALAAEKSVWGFLYQDKPSTLLLRSLQVMEVFVAFLRRLCELAAKHSPEFHSEGFRQLFAMLQAELDEPYLGLIEEQLKELRFRRGKLISAALGPTNKGADYVLRRPRERSLRQRLQLANRSRFTFTLPDRDQSGQRALSELEDRGLVAAATALAQAADHVLKFFVALRTELGFYLACLNLHETLDIKGGAKSFPDPYPAEALVMHARGLYDLGLALTAPGPVVANDLEADGKALVMITGANHGGKSTFLRAVGVAQLMMQAGMFVAADEFAANACEGVFTHFKREEDAAMEGGKLDEELKRMSEIAARISTGALLLCNESFASTNEREGSEIGRQVIRAMSETGVKVLFVTHLFDLADSLFRQNKPARLFLRAERKADGTRTFRLLEGEPLPTSHGKDSYERIFGAEVATASAPGTTVR